MTNHPITPPPELVQQWLKERTLLKSQPLAHTYLATRAAQWGADQELEACCALMELSDIHARDFLQSARRSKPLSLKGQALEALAHILNNSSTQLGADTIRRALEQLPDNE
jgi:hypothetical protein